MASRIERAGSRRFPGAPMAILVAGLLISVAAPAGDWVFSPRVNLEQVYTDNINLSPDGGEDEEFVTRLSPGLQVSGRGSRLKLDAVYSGERVIYHRDQGVDATHHQLRAVANAELAERLLFLDLDAGVSQQNLDNTVSTAQDNISGGSTRSDVHDYSVSPYLRYRFGGHADVLARYTTDSVRYLQSSGSDSTSQELNINLSSGRNVRRFPWSVQFSDRHIENETGSDSDFRKITARLNYRHSAHLGLFLSLGTEDNDFATSQINKDGRSTSLGFNWTPTTRTQLEASVGDRYYGTSYSLNGLHRARHATWQVRYSEETFTTRQRQLEHQLVALPVDDLVLPDPVPDGVPLVLVTTPTVTTEVYIRRFFQGSVMFMKGRNTVNLGVFDEDRDFQLSGENENVYGINASWNRRTSRLATLSTRWSWQRSEFAGAQEDEETRFAVSYRRRLGRQLDASIEYSLTDRESSVITNEYSENRLIARLGMTF